MDEQEMNEPQNRVSLLKGNLSILLCGSFLFSFPVWNASADVGVFVWFGWPELLVTLFICTHLELRGLACGTTVQLSRVCYSPIWLYMVCICWRWQRWDAKVSSWLVSHRHPGLSPSLRSFPSPHFVPPEDSLECKQITAQLDTECFHKVTYSCRLDVCQSEEGLLSTDTMYHFLVSLK